MIKPTEYMSSPVITADPESTVSEVTKLMDQYNIGSVVVTENEKVVGIITERDIIRKVLSSDKEPHRVLANQVMTSKVYCVERDASMMDIAAQMKEHTMRRIVVVDNEKPVGIITSRDLIALFTK